VSWGGFVLGFDFFFMFYFRRCVGGVQAVWSLVSWLQAKGSVGIVQVDILGEFPAFQWHLQEELGWI
jgi:hypothetical protein